MENKIQHSTRLRNGELRYVCNEACDITKEKCAVYTGKKVTCKNCLKQLNKPSVTGCTTQEIENE